MSDELLRFSRSALVELPEPARAERCDALAARLSARLRTSDDRRRVIAILVAELRAAGWDLWSYDESDDVEVWGPDYHTPSGPGIVVTFELGDFGGAVVEWTER